jgi:hypothetical protein
MDDSKIDALILSTVNDRWSKVARVIGVIMVTEDVAVSKVDELGTVVQARIEALIQSGLLESQGNVQNWRHSEVRRV